jgi:hypothetical protein
LEKAINMRRTASFCLGKPIDCAEDAVVGSAWAWLSNEACARECFCSCTSLVVSMANTAKGSPKALVITSIGLFKCSQA